MRKRCTNRLAGALTIGGAVIFVIAVAGLQLMQPQYDPVHQYMSELVFGRAGSIMLIGFCGLGISIFSAQFALRTSAAPRTIRALLACAATCMVGAGVIDMGENVEIHFSLAILAFALLVISMYLLPLSVARFSSSSSRKASWLLMAGAAVSLALTGTVPEGISQRIAATCVLAWLFWLGLRTVRSERGDET